MTIIKAVVFYYIIIIKIKRKYKNKKHKKYENIKI